MVKHYPDNYFLPYSPRVKQIIAYANDEAKRSGAEKIGTEHLLLGLLRDEEILASRIMLNLGLSLSRMRQLLKKKMGQEPTRNQMHRHQIVASNQLKQNKKLWKVPQRWMPWHVT